jgi:hypothetical protein
VLAHKAKVVQNLGVLLGVQHIGLNGIDRRPIRTEHRQVRLTLGDFSGNAVRWHVGVRRNLNRVTVLEPHGAIDMRSGLFKHGWRVVDADHFRHVKLLRGQCSELAGTTTKVNGAVNLRRLDKSQQTVEGLGALGGKSPLLLRVPVDHNLYCTCI